MERKGNFRIDFLGYPVIAGPDAWDEIRNLVQHFLDPGGIFILTDQNTREFCLPALIRQLPFLQDHPVFSVKPGESSKNFDTLETVWHWLMDNGATKDSMLVNLGGGVVTDLGGFAAATFKRGMPFINVPTSLLGQVDAAIGGKCGINVAGIKNMAGVFYDPIAVFIIPGFLETLPDEHFRSGFAEIIKCIALSGNDFPVKGTGQNIRNGDISVHIANTVLYKCKLVAEDPLDKSVRKALNFGHTVGHAIESFSYGPGREPVLHGNAVAAGMVCEAYISAELNGLQVDYRDTLSLFIKELFQPEPFDPLHFDEILKMMEHDKKKKAGELKFSLLEAPGKPKLNCPVSDQCIINSFEYFNQIAVR